MFALPQSLIAPTDIIRKSGETRTIDGVQIVFAMAPGKRSASVALYGFSAVPRPEYGRDRDAHVPPLLPFRGAEVRDALAWSKCLNAALEEFGGRTDVLIVQHQWPVFGAARARAFLAGQRDLYKHVHDQTVRLMMRKA